MTEPTPTYIAIAYRWGCFNDHWYILTAGTDEQAVCQSAASECQDRGGKYGVAVYRVTGECWDAEHEMVHYSPSISGESKPHRNERTWLNERVGHVAVGVVEDGDVWVADEHGKCTLQPVDCPEWLRQCYEQEKAMAAIYCKRDAP